VGFIAQRSSFCTTGAFSKLFLFKSWHMLSGVISLVITVFVLNLFLGQFNPGFTSQPIAHTSYLWSFLGMLLAGLAFTLGSGCPGRQLVRAGEGDLDAAIFLIGMLVGAAFSHNFLIAASPAGINTYSAIAVIIGLIYTVWLGLTVRGS